MEKNSSPCVTKDGMVVASIYVFKIGVVLDVDYLLIILRHHSEVLSISMKIFFQNN